MSRRIAILFIIITGCLCSLLTLMGSRTLGMVMICLWLLISLYVIWYRKFKWLPVILGLLTLLTVFGPVDVKFTGAFRQPRLQEVYTGPRITPEQQRNIIEGDAIWYGDYGPGASLAPRWLIIW